jgi:fimbrial chaperone protein
MHGWFRWVLRLCMLTGAMLAGAASQAASSVLLWPINPVLEADQSATAVWLENRGKQAVTLQIRVLGWRQANFEDDYVSQKAIVASPPFATIEPGKRQLVRLIRQGPLPERSEDAYRIVIDEVPDAQAPLPTQKSGMGVQFQMRYSLPFFVTAPGVWTQARADITRESSTAAQPKLSWQFTTVQGVRYLEIHNSGAVHARLSRVRWVGNGGEVIINDGLLGYVLPGQRMRWKLAASAAPKAGMRLVAQLADNATAVDIPKQ